MMQVSRGDSCDQQMRFVVQRVDAFSPVGIGGTDVVAV